MGQNMIEKYINEDDRECYRGVTESTLFTLDLFHKPDYQFETDIHWAFHSELGSLTVLDRMTGFGFRDIESGYRDPEGNFWLASGNIDVRYSGVKTVREAIEYVKTHANICNPDKDNN